MNNSRESLISAPRTHVGDRTCRKTDMEIQKKNPKVDHQLLLEFYRLIEEYERLVAASGSGVRLRKQGADYNLAHPLARKDMPTDVYHRGKRVRETERTYT